jgi:hypothetical protein
MPSKTIVAMPRRAPLLLLALAACTPLRPLDPVDAGPASLDAARPDAARPDAAGDAPGLDAFEPDAPGPGPDAFVEGVDAFVTSPDAFVPVDAFVGLDANCLPVGPETCAGPGDEDCDGMIDEPDAVDARTWYLDADRDGYGADATVVTACRRPPDTATDRWLERGGDCDDTNELVHPGRGEVCNATDDDCDGSIDDGDPCMGSRVCFTETYGGHTYQFCDGRVPWTTARSTCEGWGYHLVHLDDAGENAFVATTADRRALGEVAPYRHLAWIGLSRAGMGLRWSDDGAMPSYASWAVGEPSTADGECARMIDSSGRWEMAECMFNVDYVCETP